MLIRDFCKRLLVTCGGLGLAPFGKGTFGTFGGLLLYAACWKWLWRDPWLMPLAGCLLCTVVSVALGPWAEKHFGKKDPGPFVLDEVAGIFLTFAGLAPNPMLLTAGFFLFRLLDIVKPWPCKGLQSLPAGWGIVVDDLAAAAYACVFLHLWLMLG